MSDSSQNNRADKIIANQGGPQYANEGDVYENAGNGTQNNTTGNVFVGGRAGDIATGGSKITKRKFRFSPLVFLGHAVRAHPAVATVTVLIVGGAVVTGTVILPHAKAQGAPRPTAATITVPARAPTHSAAPAAGPGSDFSWPQAGGGPARTGYQAGETRIGSADVTKLTLKRTYQTTAGGGGVSEPLIANGILYVDQGSLLDAFDATGVAGCSDVPVTCVPLWTASTEGFDAMTVAAGDVFVTDSGGVQAFNAAGTTNCSGTPKVCSSLWATSILSSTGPAFSPGSGSPVVVNGVLYVPGNGDGYPISQGGA
jgi:hypothetical protein